MCVKRENLDPTSYAQKRDTPLGAFIWGDSSDCDPNESAETQTHSKLALKGAENHQGHVWMARRL